MWLVVVVRASEMSIYSSLSGASWGDNLVNKVRIAGAWSSGFSSCLLTVLPFSSHCKALGPSVVEKSLGNSLALGPFSL